MISEWKGSPEGTLSFSLSPKGRREREKRCSSAFAKDERGSDCSSGPLFNLTKEGIWKGVLNFRGRKLCQRRRFVPLQRASQYYVVRGSGCCSFGERKEQCCFPAWEERKMWHWNSFTASVSGSVIPRTNNQSRIEMWVHRERVWILSVYRRVESSSKQKKRRSTLYAVTISITIM